MLHTKSGTKTDRTIYDVVRDKNWKTKQQVATSTATKRAKKCYKIFMVLNHILVV
jgi:hypothetical protein